MGFESPQWMFDFPNLKMVYLSYLLAFWPIGNILFLHDKPAFNPVTFELYALEIILE